jgi:hypothetical protein
MKYVLAAVLLTLAVVATQNLREQISRSRQKRTMADIRSIATAWETQAEKVNRYDVRDVRVLPRTDAWGTPFELAGSGNDYSIRSYGSDRRRDERLIEGPHTDFARDIVYANGAFIAYPEGI